MSERKELRPILNRLEGRATWWVDVGKGWWPLILKLDRDIAKLVPDYQVAQVKEKFGGLRYYIGGVSRAVYDEVYALIGAAEAQSFKTCEDCGQPGRSRDGGWIRTLCDSCQDASQRRRAERLSQ